MYSNRVLSGMRPTGALHLGHYHGALKNWVRLQDDYECFYFVADWHALTSDYADTSRLSSFALDNVADWIGAGLDPENLPQSDPSKMNFGSDRKAWKDIWGCGQGIGAIQSVVPAAELIERLKREYTAARARL